VTIQEIMEQEADAVQEANSVQIIIAIIATLIARGQNN
jgi:hypothetical protein